MIPQNKNKKPKEKIINFITNGTEKILEGSEWKIIGEEKKWTKNCPKCNKIQSYKSKIHLNVSIKRNTWCNRCRYDERKIDIPVGGWSKLCPCCKKVIVYPQKHILKNSIEKNCVCLSCANALYHSKPRKRRVTSESRKQMRLSRIKYIESCHGQIWPTYNKTACEYFQWLNMWNGWNGKHGLNGGEHFIKELGYWVDYYEPTQNIVIEWDEPHHYNIDGTLKMCDIRRMEEIKNYLDCRFIRFSEKLNEIKEY
jgi:hypothetical protein